MRLDMRDALCCRLSLFRVFAKIMKTVSTSPGLPYTSVLAPEKGAVWSINYEERRTQTDEPR